MCDHSQSEALEHGFKAMQFNLVVSTNDAAVRLWKRCGFEVVGTLPGAFLHPRLGYVDALVMFKRLDAQPRHRAGSVSYTRPGAAALPLTPKQLDARTGRTGAVLPHEGRIGTLRAHWYSWALGAAPLPMRLLLGLVGVAVLLAAALLWASVMFGATPMTVVQEALSPVRPGVDLSVHVVNGDETPSPPFALIGPGGTLRLGRIPAHASRSVHLTDWRYGDVALLDEVSHARYTVLSAQPDLRRAACP